jgi:retron-type reverse transcriptase
VRARVKDKRVLALVKAFLKAGVLTELGEYQDTWTGTPQGGLCSAEHKEPKGYSLNRSSRGQRRIRNIQQARPVDR